MDILEGCTGLPALVLQYCISTGNDGFARVCAPRKFSAATGQRIQRKLWSAVTKAQMP